MFDADNILTKSITATNIYRNAEDFAIVLYPPTVHNDVTDTVSLTLH